MARTRTLGDLRSDVRQRTSLESSQSVTDVEVNEYINQSIAELYDLLIASQGMEFYEKDAPSFTTVGGTTLYALPRDFYRVLRVEANLSGFNVPLKPFTHVEHGVLSQYPVQGGMIINIKYVPNPSRLVADSDTFDGFGGWEEYVILDAAMKCLEKRDEDASPLAARKLKMEQRIEAMAPNRDAFMPSRRQDVKRAPLSPYAIMPKPRYRIRGTVDFSGSTPPNIELLMGPIPGGIW
jgi:hypothetical protein